MNRRKVRGGKRDSGVCMREMEFSKLNQVVREDLAKKVNFEQRFERGERCSQEVIWERVFQAKGTIRTQA